MVLLILIFSAREAVITPAPLMSLPVNSVVAIPSCEVNEVFDYGQVSDFQTGTITASNVSDFLTDVDFIFDVSALSSFSNTTAGGSAVFENIIDSASWGKVEVAYTFDEITSVPETGSLAIFGLGLAGFALSRKAKKSA